MDRRTAFNNEKYYEPGNIVHNKINNKYYMIYRVRKIHDPVYGYDVQYDVYSFEDGRYSQYYRHNASKTILEEA